jgi:hypothetical protein
MDFEQHKRDLLAHYCALVVDPGWTDYVGARTKELARECPELYAEFPAEARAAWKRHKERAHADRDAAVPDFR